MLIQEPWVCLGFKYDKPILNQVQELCLVVVVKPQGKVLEFGVEWKIITTLFCVLKLPFQM